jgi:hypothetical protein
MILTRDVMPCLSAYWRLDFFRMFSKTNPCNVQIKWLIVKNRAIECGSHMLQGAWLLVCISSDIKKSRRGAGLSNIS